MHIQNAQGYLITIIILWLRCVMVVFDVEFYFQYCRHRITAMAILLPFPTDPSIRNVSVLAAFKVKMYINVLLYRNNSLNMFWKIWIKSNLKMYPYRGTVFVSITFHLRILPTNKKKKNSILYLFIYNLFDIIYMYIYAHTCITFIIFLTYHYVLISKQNIHYITNTIFYI